MEGYRYVFSPDIDNPWISWPGDYYPGIRRIFRRDSIEKRGGTRLLHVPCSIQWYTEGKKFTTSRRFVPRIEREKEREKIKNNRNNFCSENLDIESNSSKKIYQNIIKIYRPPLIKDIINLKIYMKTNKIFIRIFKYFVDY